MTKLSRFLYGVGFIFLLAGQAAGAQEFGTLRGSVKDPSGALLSETAITLQAVASQAVTSQTAQKTLTDASGTFVVKDIPPGAYTLQAEHAGFATLIKAVQIAPGAATSLNLSMALGMATTSVEVQASREELAETLSPGAVTVAYPDDVKGEFKSLPELLDQMPGLYVNRVSGNGQYTTVSVRGSSPTQVNIYIDGVPYNLASEAAADLSTLSISNVERVEAYRGAVPARFSGAPVGGAINIVTKTPTAFKVTGSAGARTLGGRQFSLGVNGPLGSGKLFRGGKVLFGADQERSAGDFKYTNYYLQSQYDMVFPAGIPYTVGGETYTTYTGETFCEYLATTTDTGTACTSPAERHRLNSSFGKDNLLLKWQNQNFVFKVDYLYLNRLMPYAVFEGVEDTPNPPANEMYYNARHQQKIHQNEALLGWDHTFFGKLTTSLNLNMMDQDKRYTNPDAVYPYSEFIGGTGSHYHTRRYGAEGDAVYALGEESGVRQLFELHGDWVKETLNTGMSCGICTTPGSLVMPIYTRFTTTAQLQDTLTVRALHNLEITPIGRIERMTGPTIGWVRNSTTPSQNLGWVFTSNLAVKERFARGWQAFATFGKYIRYPNFYEIYGDGINIIPRANSDGTTYAIQPEIGRTLDAGVGWDGALAKNLGGHYRLTLFERWTNNNITLVANPMQSYYMNTGNTLEHGVEFEGSLHYGSFASLQSALTVQNGWYPDKAYYVWGESLPMTPAPGYRIPTLNAPYVTGDARLDLHFLADKLTGYGEVRYTGQDLISVSSIVDANSAGADLYEGVAEYDRPLTTLDLGAHWKMPHGGTLSGGVTDLFDQGPKQTMGPLSAAGGITWKTCSESGVSVSNCPAWDLITNTVSMPVRYNVYYPQQGRTFYVTLAWQLDKVRRPRFFSHGD